MIFVAWPVMETLPAEGPWLPLPLPILAEGGLDFERLESDAQAALDHGMAGVVACTSRADAGEYAGLETDAWLEGLAEIEAPFAAHVGHPDAGEVVARAALAAPLEPEFLLVPAGIVEPSLLPGFCGDLAASTGEVPILLVEPEGSLLFEPPLIDRLLHATENLAGLVLGRRGENFDALRPYEDELIFWGDERETATAFRHGARGGLCAHALLCPAGGADWFEALEEDLDGALAFERRWQRFLEDHVHPLSERRGLARAAVDKVLATAGGVFTGSTRLLWPHEAADPSLAHTLGEAARAAGVQW